MEYKFSLKGGSLSSTDVVDHHGKLLVRKTISITNEREFGFYRWYGQYKKTMEMSKHFPEIIPIPDNFQVNDSTYSYTIPYYNNFINGYEYLRNPSADVEKFADQLFKILSNFRSRPRVIPGEWLKLYWNEEVALRLDFAFDNFEDIFEGNKLKIDGHPIVVPTKKYLWDCFNESLPKNINLINTHGNLTLENILYNPNNNKIMFIDLYEENYFDIAVNDISQLQQSCKYFYEERNNGVYEEFDLDINCSFSKPNNLNKFNEMLEQFIKKNIPNQEMKLLKSYAASQFFRMIPFKFHHSKVQAKYFFLLACQVMDDVCA